MTSTPPGVTDPADAMRDAVVDNCARPVDDIPAFVEGLRDRAKNARAEKTATGIGDAICFERSAATILALYRERNALKAALEDALCVIDADDWPTTFNRIQSVVRAASAKPAVSPKDNRHD